MIYVVVAMRDAKVGFMAPQLEVSEASAVRNFESAVLTSDSLLCTHPADFSLLKLGTYDNVSGRFDLLSVPELLCDASSIVG